jgi:hypothetical protein
MPQANLQYQHHPHISFDTLPGNQGVHSVSLVSTSLKNVVKETAAHGQKINMKMAKSLIIPLGPSMRALSAHT